MLQYFVFVWNPADHGSASHVRQLVRRCQSTDARFKVVLDLEGALATCTSAQVQAHSTAVVLGTLFWHFETACFDEAAAQRVIHSNGRELIDAYWGNYIAVWRDERHHALHILRGPASTLPCFHTRSDGIDIFFSSMELCAQLGARGFSINWAHLARSLLGPATDAQTDITEVAEILPGHVARVTPESFTRTDVWNPLRFSSSPEFSNRARAAESLRATARACVQAWGSRHQRVVHALSGGLDSAVTLAAFTPSTKLTANAAASRPEVICINQYGGDLNSDERGYARLCAERAQCELVEHYRDSNVEFRSAVTSIRSARCPGLRLPSVDRVEPDLARARGATAIFRGDGGDELFCRNHPSLYVMDFICERGWARGLLPLAMHAAASEGVTAWEILARAARTRFRGASFNFDALATEGLERVALVKAEVIAELVKSRKVPSTSRTTSPGRLWQASLLKAPRVFESPFALDSDAEYVAPLLSQPLIELCLQIPTYFQITGRRDRALARDAFAYDLPYEVVTRRDKGDAERVASASVLANLDFAREMLMDGILIQQHFVNRRRVEAALSPSPSEGAVSSVPVFGLLGAEIWARAWLRSGVSPG